MKFSISNEVFKHFPQLSVGLIIAEDINNTDKSEELNELISEIAELVKTSYTPTEFANDKMISPWKSAYFDYEEKPYNTHSSAERLMKEVIDEDDIERKNKLKDLCNFISLKYIVPIECFDAGKINGELNLKRAKGNEFFYDPKQKKKLNPEKGEFIYADKLNVLARKLDYSESDKALTSDKTKKAVILIEGLKPLTKTKVEKIAEETAELTETFCKAKTKIYLLDKENSSAEF